MIQVLREHGVYEKLIKFLMEAGYLVVLFGAVPIEITFWPV